MSRYYNKDGTPMTMMEWLKVGGVDYRRVAEDTVGEEWVSTVWLGLDHQYGDGPPLIFETMVFGGPVDQEICRRYSTLQEAEGGHAEIVAMLQTAPVRADDVS